MTLCFKNLMSYDEGGRWINLNNTVSSFTNLLFAYEQIYVKPGLMTPGLTTETISGISESKIHEISKSLVKGSFRFSPLRRLFVPKPKSSELRPITIASPIDRIVHRSVTNVLEEIYEPIFLPISYGFRPHINTHSFFHEVEGWAGIKRLIHADIKRCFENIDHLLLMELLQKRIADSHFLELIKHFLTTPIYDSLGTNFSHVGKGIPQGAVFSPILMNVVLHELDVYAINLCQNKGIYYARFADDCTIAAKVNSDTETFSVLAQLSNFIHTNLAGLTFRTTLIRREGVILGANLKLPPQNVKQGKIKIEVPMERVISRLETRGFLRPTRQTLPGSNIRTISNRYRAIALGLLSYYSACSNIQDLISFLIGNLFSSLCHALSLLTGIPRSKIQKALSKDIDTYLDSVAQAIFEIQLSTPFFCPGEERLLKREIRRQSPILESCAHKGCSKTQVKVYQARLMKDYLKILGNLVVKSHGKYYGGFAAVQKVLLRKRIPLCEKHFDLINKGKLRFSDLSLTAKKFEAHLILEDLELLERKEF